MFQLTKKSIQSVTKYGLLVTFIVASAACSQNGSVKPEAPETAPPPMAIEEPIPPPPGYQETQSKPKTKKASKKLISKNHKSKKKNKSALIAKHVTKNRSRKKTAKSLPVATASVTNLPPPPPQAPLAPAPIVNTSELRPVSGIGSLAPWIAVLAIAVIGAAAAVVARRRSYRSAR